MQALSKYLIRLKPQTMKKISIILLIATGLTSCTKEYSKAPCGTVIGLEKTGVWIQYPVRHFDFKVMDTTGIKIGQSVCN